MKYETSYNQMRTEDKALLGQTYLATLISLDSPLVARLAPHRTPLLLIIGDIEGLISIINPAVSQIFLRKT